MQVWLESWEWQCCGDPFAVGYYGIGVRQAQGVSDLVDYGPVALPQGVKRFHACFVGFADALQPVERLAAGRFRGWSPKRTEGSDLLRRFLLDLGGRRAPSHEEGAHDQGREPAAIAHLFLPPKAMMVMDFKRCQGPRGPSLVYPNSCSSTKAKLQKEYECQGPCLPASALPRAMLLVAS